MKPGQKSCVIKLIKSAYTLSARSLEKHPLMTTKLLAYTLLAQSLVKHPLKGNKASDQNHVGVTSVARQR